MTYEELMAQSRALAQSGNLVAAKRAAELAMKMKAEPAPEKTAGQRVGEFFFGDDDPNTQNLGEKIGTTLNKAGESLSLGLVGDEVSAGLLTGGRGDVQSSFDPATGEFTVTGMEPSRYAQRRDFERQQEQVLERDNPSLAIGAELGGGLLAAAIPGAGAIGTLGRGAKLLPRIAASAATGAGMGATYGGMEGEGAGDRLSQSGTGAAIGGLIGAAVPAIGAGVQRVADGRAASRAIREVAEGAPTTDELRALGRAEYNKINDAGVLVRADKVRSTMGDIADALRGEGLKFQSVRPSMPASSSVLGVADEIANATDNTMSFNDLDVARRAIGNSAASNLANRGDTRAATEALTTLDDFVRNLGPDDVDAGDIQALQEALPKARDLWARMSRSQLLDDAIEKGTENYRTGGASGMRAQFQRILNNPKLARGFSDAELKVMSRVVKGTIPEQLLNYMGSGLGMMAQAIGGSAAGAASGGMLGGVGGMLAGSMTAAGTRNLAEKVVGRNAEIARALVAAGGLEKLPVASDGARRVTEALLRRTGAVGPQ